MKANDKETEESEETEVNEEDAPDPSTNDVNINDNYDDEKMIMRLPLIHLQMVEIMKQLTMVKTNITKTRL